MHNPKDHAFCLGWTSRDYIFDVYIYILYIYIIYIYRILQQLWCIFVWGIIFSKHPWKSTMLNLNITYNLSKETHLNLWPQRFWGSVQKPFIFQAESQKSDRHPGRKSTWNTKSWRFCSDEQWKKGPWLFRVYRGWHPTQLYRDYDKPL